MDVRCATMESSRTVVSDRLHDDASSPGFVDVWVSEPQVTRIDEGGAVRLLDVGCVGPIPHMAVARAVSERLQLHGGCSGWTFAPRRGVPAATPLGVLEAPAGVGIQSRHGMKRWGGWCSLVSRTECRSIRG